MKIEINLETLTARLIIPISMYTSMNSLHEDLIDLNSGIGRIYIGVKNYLSTLEDGKYDFDWTREDDWISTIDEENVYFDFIIRLQHEVYSNV